MEYIAIRRPSARCNEVTFSTRLDMRLAAREQLGTESFALQLQAAPDVEDVNYESLLVRPSFTQSLGASDPVSLCNIYIYNYIHI